MLKDDLGFRSDYPFGRLNAEIVDLAALGAPSMLQHNIRDLEQAATKHFPMQVGALPADVVMDHLPFALRRRNNPEDHNRGDQDG